MILLQLNLCPNLLILCEEIMLAGFGMEEGFLFLSPGGNKLYLSGNPIKGVFANFKKAIEDKL